MFLLCSICFFFFLRRKADVFCLQAGGQLPPHAFDPNLVRPQ